MQTSPLSSSPPVASCMNIAAAGTDSMEPMISRYQNNCLHTEQQTTQEAASNDPGSTKFRTCKELLQSVRRLDEEPSKFSVSDMAELEAELTAALMHTRSRKTQLMFESMSNLQPLGCSRSQKRLQVRV
ncbi:hypothetical protein L2E82_35134 [Cichorium intybus]|uniref:Uncharacterized protein n=1 Tax=Cichorium intybus TaxID=13427 RepID=A0ACB9BN95_CICIN|nr:hypothetical protein L2E82_35134 [Cichorium intybus]